MIMFLYFTRFKNKTAQQLFMLSCLFFNFMVLSQDHLFYVENRIGLPVSSSHETILKRNDIALKYDFGALFGYEYKLLKQTNTSLFTSLSLSKSTYNFQPYYYFNGTSNSPIIEATDNFNFSRRHLSFQLGMRQRFSLLDDRLNVGFGLSATKRLFPDKQVSTAGNSFNYNDSVYMRFEYDITTFHDGQYTPDGFISNSKKINLDTDIFVTWKLNDYLNLKLSCMYSRNYQVYYLYKLNYTNVMLDQIIFSGTIHNGNVGTNGSLDYITNDLLFTSIGLEFNLSYFR